MAGKRIVIPNYMPALDLNGNPQAGAKLYFYENETTTLKATYTSAALSVAHPNPVVASAAGVFPSIFADDAESFSVAITDAADAPIGGLRNKDDVMPSLVYGADSAAAEAAAAEAEAFADAAAANLADALAIAATGDDAAAIAARVPKNTDGSDFSQPDAVREALGAPAVAETVRPLSAYGALTAGSVAKATVEAAVAGVGSGGSVVLDQNADTGTTPAVVGEVDLLGSFSVYHTPAGGGGRRVQNLPGRDPARLMWGQESLYWWLEGLRTASARTVVAVGDSNTAGYLGSQLLTRLDGLPNVSVTNMGASGEDIEEFRTGAGVFASNGKALSDLITASPDLIIFAYPGTNESLSGRTPEDYGTSLDLCLTDIRAAMGADECSILLMTANAMNADTGTGGLHPDELYNAQVRPFIRAAAEKHNCAFFDKNGLFPNAFADFGEDLWLDSFRVHTNAVATAMYLSLLWEFLVPPGITTDSSAMTADRAVADLPDAYPKGVSLSRMTDGPVTGFALTFNPLSTGGTYPVQFVFGLSGAGPSVSVRHASATNAWGNFCAIGAATLLQDQVAVATAISGFPFGRSIQRATTGYPHNGFVETFRESINGTNGYQISISAVADVAAQIRVSRSGTWGAWRLVGFNLDDLTDAADNAAASAAGVPSKGAYRNGGIVMVRTT